MIVWHKYTCMGGDLEEVCGYSWDIPMTEKVVMDECPKCRQAVYLQEVEDEIGWCIVEVALYTEEDEVRGLRLSQLRNLPTTSKPPLTNKGVKISEGAKNN